jgi:hypothetical protein
MDSGLSKFQERLSELFTEIASIDYSHLLAALSSADNVGPDAQFTILALAYLSGLDGQPTSSVPAVHTGHEGHLDALLRARSVFGGEDRRQLPSRLARFFSSDISFVTIAELGGFTKRIDLDALRSRWAALVPIARVLKALFEFHVAKCLPVHPATVGASQARVVPGLGRSAVLDLSTTKAHSFNHHDGEGRGRTPGRRSPSPWHPPSPFGTPRHRRPLSSRRSASPPLAVRQQSPIRCAPTTAGHVSRVLQRLSAIDPFDVNCLVTPPIAVRPYLVFCVLALAVCEVLPKRSVSMQPTLVLRKVFRDKWRTSLAAFAELGLQWFPTVLFAPLQSLGPARAAVVAQPTLLRSSTSLALLVQFLDALHDLVIA